jgi:hypothetical protein
MQWHEFFFSGARKHKAMRHLVFWASWWLYFSLCHLLYQQSLPFLGIRPPFLTPGDYAFLKTSSLVLLFVITLYPFVYYFFPQLIQGKWLKAITYFILICLFLFITSYFLYWKIFPLIDSSNTSPKVSSFWPPINLGVMNFIKVAAAAIVIKYVKYWWLKQKESERLDREKINAELQLLRAQVHPDFLFNTLNSIYDHALLSSPRTSQMLLKLSDLLSYMLYECDGLTVSLEKEIEMMKEYMQLEKIRHECEPEIQINIKGELSGKNIAPFLLLPFIENSFRHCSQTTEQFWINMDIRMERDNFSVKLTHGMSEIPATQAVTDTISLTNVKKRLFLLYPGKHELKMTGEQEMFIVLLNIQLDAEPVASFNNEEAGPPLSRNKIETASDFKYASD